MKKYGVAGQLIAGFLLLAIASTPSPGTEERQWRTSEIRIRDPFILPVAETKTYYLYASAANRTGDKTPRQGVEAYLSGDLKIWQGPYSVFEVPADFWAPWMVWAPEVHRYKDRFYLFVTFTSRETLGRQTRSKDWPDLYKRGTQILAAASPLGPFLPFRNAPHTPPEWQALDGTLALEDGRPYMVFCHEWVQVGNGTVEAMPLAPDLSEMTGKPRTLFRGADAPWVKRSDRYVTDGPFVFRTKRGRLLMIWSSFGERGYALGIAVSASGRVAGPWRQLRQPLFSEDGGHGMIFRTFGGDLVLALHQPNRSPEEKLNLLRLRDTGDSLEIAGKLE